MSPSPTYSVRVSLYLKSHSVLLDSSHTDIQKWYPPRSYHPDLKKKAGGEVAIFEHNNLSMLLHSCQLDYNKEYTPKTFTSSLTWSTRLDPVLPSVFSSSSWGRLQYSFVLTWWKFTAVVVVWMKCPALVTRTLKTPKKTPITSAGMSRQAMSTTATVGCLNSCYTRFHTILVCLCVSWLLCTVAHAVAPARRFFLCTSFVVCFSGLMVI